MVIKSSLEPTSIPFEWRKKAVELDDGILVQRCLDGDPDAFQCLVQRYQKKLFATAFGMLHQVEDALDIVQEAFLKVYRNLPKFQGNSSFYTWVYRIVINLCIDFLRKEGRQQTQDFDECLQQATDAVDLPLISNSQGFDPGKALHDKELAAHLQKAIESLSPSHKSVIILREVEGLSYEEIAQTLECSKGTVMSRLHHARARLRQALASYLQEDAPAHTPSEFGNETLSDIPEQSVTPQTKNDSYSSFGTFESSLGK